LTLFLKEILINFVYSICYIRIRLFYYYWRLKDEKYVNKKLISFSIFLNMSYHPCFPSLILSLLIILIKWFISFSLSSLKEIIIGVSIIDPTQRVNLIRPELDPTRHDPKINGSDMSLFFWPESSRVGFRSTQPDPINYIFWSNCVI
jgi:hypothetical protein